MRHGRPGADPGGEQGEEVRTSVGTGFRRVTVVAPDSRVDVALPETIAVSDIYPEILRLTRQTQPADAPTGYYLFRTDGSALDSSRSLADQRVVDGEMLHLRPFAQSLPMRPSTTMSPMPWPPRSPGTGACGTTACCGASAW